GPALTTIGRCSNLAGWHTAPGRLISEANFRGLISAKSDLSNATRAQIILDAALNGECSTLTPSPRTPASNHRLSLPGDTESIAPLLSSVRIICGGLGFESRGDSSPLKPKIAILECRKRFPQRDNALFTKSRTLCSPDSLIRR